MARPIQLIPNAPKVKKVDAGVTGGDKKVVASNRKARHDYDILETLQAEDTSNVPVSPAAQLEQAQLLTIIEKAIEKLPGRQREAFMLRYWEEFDVAETAEAMGCSQGSVKTHCSRAVFALSKALRAKGITVESYLKPDSHHN